MGRARVVYKCGHVEKIILFGGIEDEYRMTAESEKLCSDCWIADQIKLAEKKNAKKKKKVPYRKGRQISL